MGKAMAEGKKKRKKPKPQEKGGFWNSNAAIRAYVVLGVPVVLLLSWYAYTVVFEFNKPEMKKFESELAGTIKDIATRAIKEGFSVESVDICQNMIKEYTTPRGWHYTDEALHTLVGLPESSLGQMPGSGGSVRVARIAGLTRAKDMVMLGTRTNNSKANGLVMLEL